MAAIFYGTAAAAVDVAEGEIANSSAVWSLPCRMSWARSRRAGLWWRSAWRKDSEQPCSPSRGTDTVQSTGFRTSSTPMQTTRCTVVRPVYKHRTRISWMQLLTKPQLFIYYSNKSSNIDYLYRKQIARQHSCNNFFGQGRERANKQNKQLIFHWFDPSWNMVVLSGTHICRKIRINSRRSIGGHQDLWKTTKSDRAASLQFSRNWNGHLSNNVVRINVLSWWTEVDGRDMLSTKNFYLKTSTRYAVTVVLVVVQSIVI